MAAPSVWDRVRRRWQWHVAQPLDERVRAPVRHRRNRGRVYRPVFVGGASGSGTSLLAVSLGQRFDCAGVIYETNFQVPRHSFLYVPDIDEFASVAAYQDFMTPKADWAVEQGREHLLDCYRRYCSGPSDVVVDKGPDINLLRAQYLARCFPDGCFLAIFRDPVANVEGLRRKWAVFRNAPLAETIRFYAEIHESFLEATESVSDRTCLVEYEKLVERPEDVLDAIGDRLGLRTARRLRRVAWSPDVEGRGIRNVKGNAIGYVLDANRRSRDRLEPAQTREIEAALLPLWERMRRSPLNL